MFMRIIMSATTRLRKITKTTKELQHTVHCEYKVLQIYLANTACTSIETCSNICFMPIRSRNCVYLFAIEDAIKEYTSIPIHIQLDRRQGFKRLPGITSLWAKDLLQVLENEDQNKYDIANLALSFQCDAIKTEDDYTIAYSSNTTQFCSRFTTKKLQRNQ
ncbi:hypothetical protein BJV82DRAFT_380529 [Fennellomyces sp. T-0311]|nr:hypothetical protein BJV82DRAFT_380529 [Fennellomyces sp. T-0311]